MGTNKSNNENLIISQPRSRRKRFEENYKTTESGEDIEGSEDSNDSNIF